MTLDIIYNKFIDDLIKSSDTVAVIRKLFNDVHKYCFNLNDSNLVNWSIKLNRTYINSIIYYNTNNFTNNLKEAILSIDSSNKSIYEKINIISGITSFFFRKDNIINIYERDDYVDYDSDSYIKYGVFLTDIDESHYDWIVPIIGSKRVESIVKKLFYYDSLFYLKHIYYHFYKLFFPYHNQNLELYDIFSEIDMFLNVSKDNSFTTESQRFLYRNIREVQVKAVVKKKTKN